MSREHPLLMRPELVRATLSRRKTQTRRLVTRANSRIVNADVSGTKEREAWDLIDWANARPASTGPGILAPDRTAGRGWSWLIEPRVRPGDVLWIREAWMQSEQRFSDGSRSRNTAYRADLAHGAHWDDGERHFMVHGYAEKEAFLPRDYRGGRWRPGIHMPRWACRLTLPVEAVRGEQVQSISEEDALAEGVESWPHSPEQWDCAHSFRFGDAPYKGSFCVLWDMINGHRDGAAWIANPWTWVYQWPAVGGPRP
jgi:hypothetical protein